MAQQYMAVPLDHTVIHLSLLHALTYTNQVYNRLIATGYANLVQQAVLGFPSTPETSNKKGPIPSKAEVKAENPNRISFRSIWFLLHRKQGVVWFFVRRGRSGPLLAYDTNTLARHAIGNLSCVFGSFYSHKDA